MKSFKGRWIEILILALTFVLVVFQMLSSQIFLLSTIPYLNFHIMMCILLTILHIAKVTESSIKRIWCYAMALLTILAFGYIQLNWGAVKDNAYFNTPFELVVGGVIIFLALESTRLGMGAFLPIFIHCICGVWLRGTIPSRAIQVPIHGIRSNLVQLVHRV